MEGTKELLAVAARCRASQAVVRALHAFPTSLDWACLWREPEAAVALLHALTGHPCLKQLSFADNRFDVDADAADVVAVGAALGALVAANATSLETLDLTSAFLFDGGMRALFEALPHNTHLRTLQCGDNYLSEEFEQECVLPAVQANTSLWDFDGTCRTAYDPTLHGDALPAIYQAEAFVAARTAARQRRRRRRTASHAPAAAAAAADTHR
jgi:hypothetical protein